MNPAALGMAPEGVVERGRQAGRDLGDDPAATVDELVSRVFDELGGAGDPLITVIGGGASGCTPIADADVRAGGARARYCSCRWHFVYLASRCAGGGDAVGGAHRGDGGAR